MENISELFSMVKVVLQGRVLTQAQLAEITTGSARLLGYNESDIPQLIKEVESEFVFSLEIGKKIDRN